MNEIQIEENKKLIKELEAFKSKYYLDPTEYNDVNNVIDIVRLKNIALSKQ
jgi:hypothetical protein